MAIKHSDAIDQFVIIHDKEKEQRSFAIEDNAFANAEDAQWDDIGRTSRANRPRYTINRVAPAIAQITGDQRQNTIAINVIPTSSDADKGLADVYKGLIRNIEAQSKAQNAYDCAFDEQVTGGYGGWRIITEFTDDSFDQEIKIKPIKSAASTLYFDSMAQEYDKRDAGFAFLVTAMSKKAFEKEFPDALETSFDVEQYWKNNTWPEGWFSDNVVRVAEYWYKEEVTKEIGLMTDGRILDLEDEKDVIDELAILGTTVVRTRKVKSHKVFMRKMNGVDWISEPQEFPSKYIPLIPVFGKVSNIEGKEFIRGLVRFSKDSQRIYNYATSANIEAVALSPKDPYWLTSIQAKGYTSQLKRYNISNEPFMFYNFDPKAPGPPVRSGAPQVQTALLQQVEQASRDIEATTGMHSASMGNGPQLLSEKSLISQAEKGDRGAFIYSDNLSKSIQYTGDILVDVIPRVVDTQQVIRILNIDGSTEEVEVNVKGIDNLNQPVVDEDTGEQVIVNDLNRGKYDVTVTSGPAFATKRQETVQQLIDLAASSEVFAELTMDIIAKNLDVLEGEELAKRMRSRMIQQGTVEPTEEEAEELGLNEEQPPSPEQIAILENIQSETQKNMADIAKTESEIAINTANTELTLTKADKTNAETLSIVVETMLDKIRLGLPVTQEEVALVINQRDIMIENQIQS